MIFSEESWNTHSQLYLYFERYNINLWFNSLLSRSVWWGRCTPTHSFCHSVHVMYSYSVIVHCQSFLQIWTQNESEVSRDDLLCFVTYPSSFQWYRFVFGHFAAENGEIVTGFAYLDAEQMRRSFFSRFHHLIFFHCDNTPRSVHSCSIMRYLGCFNREAIHALWATQTLIFVATLVNPRIVTFLTYSSLGLQSFGIVPLSSIAPLSVFASSHWYLVMHLRISVTQLESRK